MSCNLPKETSTLSQPDGGQITVESHVDPPGRDGGTAAVVGIAQDSKGNLYKMTLSPPTAAAATAK